MRIQIPPQFLAIPYDFDRHPQSAAFDFDLGANCQLYAFALLLHFGICVPPFRSSDLWEDETHTEAVSDLLPLDLLLFHDNPNAWGAHVAVYIGDNSVVHLSKRVGIPAIATIEEMLADPRYCVLIGAKRVRRAEMRSQPSPN